MRPACGIFSARGQRAGSVIDAIASSACSSVNGTQALPAPRLAGTIRGENKVQRQNQYRDLILVIAEIAETAFRD